MHYKKYRIMVIRIHPAVVPMKRVFIRYLLSSYIGLRRRNAFMTNQ